ncbi:MAG: hypothetical protein IJI80_04410 [Methanobrevibacter sp.]|uniref:hypothetical protein n=1 Tax=Methanobrevibacter sp. TaxID=66852 RepID=UPI0025DD7CC3|nr:hypothetical protein [Methanobrevibacter sp.]MBQ6099000.1 hypothetical protein [Methanobrevibacter sp.]MBQ6138901.1 hypothetical protein [Methanobrevibacter sp.]
MTEMIICGLSMEMEMAREMGTVGKCRGCVYCNRYSDERIVCSKKGVLEKEKENCKEWVVDYR